MDEWMNEISRFHRLRVENVVREIYHVTHVRSIYVHFHHAYVSFQVVKPAFVL